MDVVEDKYPRPVVDHKARNKRHKRRYYGNLDGERERQRVVKRESYARQLADDPVGLRQREADKQRDLYHRDIEAARAKVRERVARWRAKQKK